MLDFLTELLKCKNIKIISILFLFCTNFLLGLTSLFVFKKELIISFDSIKLLLICSSIYLPIIIICIGIFYFYNEIERSNDNNIYLSIITGNIAVASVTFMILYRAYQLKPNLSNFINNLLLCLLEVVIIILLFKLTYLLKKKFKAIPIILLIANKIILTNYTGIIGKLLISDFLLIIGMTFFYIKDIYNNRN